MELCGKIKMLLQNLAQIAVSSTAYNLFPSIFVDERAPETFFYTEQAWEDSSSHHIHIWESNVNDFFCSDLGRLSNQTEATFIEGIRSQDASKREELSIQLPELLEVTDIKSRIDRKKPQTAIISGSDLLLHDTC